MVGIPAAVADTVTKVVTVVILSEVETWVVAAVVEEAVAEGDIKKILSISLTLLAGKQNRNYFNIIFDSLFQNRSLNLRQLQIFENIRIISHGIFN